MQFGTQVCSLANRDVFYSITRDIRSLMGKSNHRHCLTVIYFSTVAVALRVFPINLSGI